MLVLPNLTPIRVPAAGPPVLVVAVDTEEEFDWSAPFDRSATATTAMHEVWRFQALCESFGIRPVYVVDYPVASQIENLDRLLTAVAAKRAVVGAQLHPWVNPPDEEAISAPNSYLGNLPEALQRAKLQSLVARIERTFGHRPTIFKAGRYGLGPATPALLAEFGFEIDMSVSSGFDFGGDGGPDYTGYSADLFWFGPGRSLLEIPTTGGFVGYLGWCGGPLYRTATHPTLRWSRLAGILSHARALKRLRLSPEGMTLRDNEVLTRALHDRGVRVFTFSLHSPSLKPGCTRYVRTEGERDRFLDHCRSYFEFFLREFGGVAMTPHEIRDMIGRKSAQTAV